MEEIEPAPAPLFDSTHFGCSYDTWCDEISSEREAEMEFFPLSLHRDIGLGKCCGAKGQPSAPLNRSNLNRHRKQEYGIDEFDPSSLIDGQIDCDAYKADFLDDLPEEHHVLFVKNLEHLDNLKHKNITSKKWKPELGLQRTDAEFEDNGFLYFILGLDDLLKPIPFGRNPMAEEYWARKGLDYDTMVDQYFEKEREHAEEDEEDWLTGDEEKEVNYIKYAKFDEPLEEPWDMEIAELERLPVEEGDDHPVFPNEMVVASAYGHCKPEVMIEGKELVVGEEKYPDCPRGETAWRSLQTYREDSHRLCMRST
jgi:hypothetical protein